MKSLNLIQKLSKLGKILSKIVFIFCIIGACGCTVSLLSLSGLKSSNLVIEGKNIMTFIEETSQTSFHTLISVCVSGIIFSVCEAITAKFAENYFKRELEDGTPFTEGGAKQMLNLGIICVSLSIGAIILSSITETIFASIWNDIQPLEYSGFSALSIGVMFIVMSFVCKYGSEIKNQNLAETTTQQTSEIAPKLENAKPSTTETDSNLQNGKTNNK